MQEVAGRHWTQKWWGGPLADGTVIVTNPINPSVGIVDRTATATTSTPMYHSESSEPSFKQWWYGRVDSVRVPLGFPIAPMRGSLVMAGAGIALVGTVFFLLGTPYWAAVLFVFLAALVAVGLLALNEWRKFKPSDWHVVDESDRSPLAPLRYVDTPVSDSPDWDRIARVADEIGPSSLSTEYIHRLLWQAADLRVDLLTNELGKDERAQLAVIADQAESLLNTP